MGGLENNATSANDKTYDVDICIYLTNTPDKCLTVVWVFLFLRHAILSDFVSLLQEKLTMAPITLFFLQASRSIRTAWLLEELGLDYEIKFWDRQEHQQAPEDAKGACGSPVGRFPTIKDGELFVFESGAITE